MVKDQTKSPDFFLLAAISAIMVLGVLILSSASALFSQSQYQDSYYLIRHQLVMGVLPGMILAVIAYKIPLIWLRKMAPFMLLGSVFLLIMIFIPGIGFSAGGAQRWIHLGFATIQPSEVLKPVFIIYLASWLAARFDDSKSYKKTVKKNFGSTFAAFLMVVSLIGALLIKQPDLSTFGIVALVAFGMYFLAGTPFRHSLFMIVAGVLLLTALVAFEPYRLERLSSWLSPQTDPLGKSFQSNQALIIVGSGGAFGQGLGSSSSKYTLLPELIGDSVFAPYSHEIGFVGCFLLMALFVLFAWRGFLIARLSRDKFENLIVSGIVIWICLQSVINISSTTGLIPLSGVPLPFISYGGTAVAMELAAIGLILNISRQGRAQ